VGSIRKENSDGSEEEGAREEGRTEESRRREEACREEGYSEEGDGKEVFCEEDHCGQEGRREAGGPRKKEVSEMQGDVLALSGALFLSASLVAFSSVA
jgi:hypothetical protein